MASRQTQNKYKMLITATGLCLIWPLPLRSLTSGPPLFSHRCTSQHLIHPPVLVSVFAFFRPAPFFSQTWPTAPGLCSNVTFPEKTSLTTQSKVIPASTPTLVDILIHDRLKHKLTILSKKEFCHMGYNLK